MQDQILPHRVVKQLEILKAAKKWQKIIELGQQFLVQYPNNSYHFVADKVHKHYINALIEEASFTSAFAEYQLERRDTNKLTIASNEVLCCVAVRNESMRLPYFLKYYRQKKVTRFFIIDNDSTDGTLEYLLAQADVHVWSSTLSFRDANFGAAWFELLMRRYGLGHWVLIVDADELLYYPMCEKTSLPQFCERLSAQDAKAYNAILLDMYSDKTIDKTHYTVGHDFLDTCPFFDGQYYHIQRPFHGSFSTQTVYSGGVRKRVFGGDSRAYCLNKIPLLYYTEACILSGGQHATNYPIEQISSGRGCVLHFKFFASFFAYAIKEAKRKVHAAQASEYSTYAEILDDEHTVSLYDALHSVRLIDSEQLIELGIMRQVSFFENEYKLYSSTDNDKQLVAYIKMGESWFTKGNTQKASSYYRKAIELVPRLEMVYHRLAQILQKGGQYKEAIVIYKQLLSFTPNDIALKHKIEGFENSIRSSSKIICN